MSHIVQIKTQVRDWTAIQAATLRLGLAPPVQGAAKLFAAEVAGAVVQLRGWNYPVVFDLASGEIKYDNYGGRWGVQRELDGFLQAYACEKAKLEARKRGHSVSEQLLADGSVKLVVVVSGGAA